VCACALPHAALASPPPPTLPYPSFHSLVPVTTVNMRNALLGLLQVLDGAFWLPKNIMVIRKAPVATSAAAAIWDASLRSLLANLNRVAWYD
jgi:hypothetical protein